jgi:rRNA biogenesis protein RRP5
MPSIEEEQQSSLKTTEESTSFPRGGAKSLTQLEVREAREQATMDFDPDAMSEDDEAPEDVEVTDKKRDRKRSRNNVTDEQEAKRAKAETTVEPLTYKKLSIGMTLLGSIKEVNDLDIVMSLPNQLTGFVSITEISAVISNKVESAAADSGSEDEEDAEIPDLREMFQVGQLFPCAITALEESGIRRRIELSIIPKTVNSYLTGLDVASGMVCVGTN